MATKPPKDLTGQMLLEMEKRRQALITKGEGKINTAFEAFDPSYFQGFRKDYNSYYMPQVDDQFTGAKQGLQYNLARNRMTNSTSGIGKFSDLVDSYTDRRREVAENALGATNDLKNQVKQTKNTLLSQNTVAANPTLASQSALSSVGALRTKPQFSPLADLFSNLVNASAVNYSAGQKAMPAGYSTGANFFSGGPSRVVG